MKIEAIAKVCHEANRAYCESLGDCSQSLWESAAEWQKESAINGVRWRLENYDTPASAQHDAWCNDKLADGWKHGPAKDAEKKEHPCICPYDQLPEFQQFKDALFVGVVKALCGKKL